MDTLTELTEKFRSVWPLLDERTRRIMAASEARALGHGGVSLVRRACGLSRKAIAKGIREIEEGFVPMEGRIRRPGAGGKPLTVSDPGLVEQLEEMSEVQTRGDPESPLRWICKSTRAIAKELARHKHPVSHTKVARSFTTSTTVCRAIGRPRKGKIIRTATPSFGTSAPPSDTA